MSTEPALTGAAEGSGVTTFDLNGSWRLHPKVSIRPERFGALLYHFGTRRLSFLKSTTLLDVVQRLESEPTALAACERAGVPPEDTPLYARSLSTLAASHMICERSPS